MDCTNYVVKTKTLISYAVTVKLICAFVFAYAKSRFPYDTTHMLYGESRKMAFYFTTLIFCFTADE